MAVRAANVLDGAHDLGSGIALRLAAEELELSRDARVRAQLELAAGDRDIAADRHVDQDMKPSLTKYPAANWHCNGDQNGSAGEASSTALPSPRRKSATSAAAQNAGNSHPPPGLDTSQPFLLCTITMVPRISGTRRSAT